MPRSLDMPDDLRGPEASVRKAVPNIVAGPSSRRCWSGLKSPCSASLLSIACTNASCGARVYMAQICSKLAACEYASLLLVASSSCFQTYTMRASTCAISWKTPGRSTTCSLKRSDNSSVSRANRVIVAS
jgi:hypothetical protein